MFSQDASNRSPNLASRQELSTCVGTSNAGSQQLTEFPAMLHVARTCTSRLLWTSKGLPNVGAGRTITGLALILLHDWELIF
jgi:hypothetical protein